MHGEWCSHNYYGLQLQHFLSCDPTSILGKSVEIPVHSIFHKHAVLACPWVATDLPIGFQDRKPTILYSVLTASKWVSNMCINLKANVIHPVTNVCTPSDPFSTTQEYLKQLSWKRNVSEQFMQNSKGQYTAMMSLSVHNPLENCSAKVFNNLQLSAQYSLNFSCLYLIQQRLCKRKMWLPCDLSRSCDEVS